MQKLSESRAEAVRVMQRLSESRAERSLSPDAAGYVCGALPAAPRAVKRPDDRYSLRLGLTIGVTA